jgi:YD repeat-containing protein
MKVKYDQQVDVLRIRFSSAEVTESDEEKPGVILDLDYDGDGNIVGIEILNASRRMEDPRSLEYAVA